MTGWKYENKNVWYSTLIILTAWCNVQSTSFHSKAILTTVHIKIQIS